MRPYVVVNVAMSADGKLSTRERRQVKISGSLDFNRVDRLKAGSDAVMVGIGTVLADDPSLTVKGEECRQHRIDRGADEHPIRVVVDSRARIPLSASILHKGSGRRIVAVSENADTRKIAALQELATVIVAGKNEVDLVALMDTLGEMGIQRLMVEGGGQLIAGLIRAGLVDEIYTFIGNIIIGGRDAPTLADGEGFVREEEFPRLTLIESRRIESGILLHWKVEQTDS
ncbi:MULTISPECIES: 2,5-diamino-6-(ribosylamino)-4(3H)-pyrimidinone 5'-phosphate reductase [unclassified Methanoregula]|uniref:2,5-diamino-6-(ribosylamino)-4(3H)-pyrimidinone 5'-phosphate reductase n=1 Tax=unclassified Methanoregula TaxID=2649730 RepID=UPI0009C6FBE2|nr:MULTISPECIES: 2,5-diamino-6-(ribosylamino)-4(3H)-pyrimidinone 5'-phosphate reductase [unclassified Methanoregula]OPX63643.1 MAG: 2,5-diamino-6-ribosylamino-4(3H)-pyrimidinone 5'-phosphate reductase [Methanoregula sp. PtaB.Bin085]OPY36191.1 MAG: 2,5-diamino-6-ribosylamino-4(3H)-pyrimidinone 5'-phosphate reductase [Methanoregula sp. PtaU1.Bin006]